MIPGAEAIDIVGWAVAGGVYGWRRARRSTAEMQANLNQAIALGLPPIFWGKLLRRINATYSRSILCWAAVGAAICYVGLRLR